MAEAGLPDFHVLSWIGLLAPLGTPRPIIERLNAEANAVMAMPEVQQAMRKTNTEPGGGTPEQFAERIRTEIAAYRSYVAKSGLVPESIRSGVRFRGPQPVDRPLTNARSFRGAQ